MAHVFRLPNIQGDNNIVDWGSFHAYGPNDIRQIEDPEGASASREITSIPSPFARFDLVKTAFRELLDFRDDNNRVIPIANLTDVQLRERMQGGNNPNIYHRLVSEVFDVAEIFFNIDRLRDKFEIVAWNRDNDLDDNSIFGRTLRMFLQSDGTAYNFDAMDSLYFLKYVGPDNPDPMSIVGFTSPTTLFASTANNLSYVTNHVAFGHDRPFDTNFNALYGRDFDFQYYFYAFRAAHGNFAQRFPELNDYLDANYRCLNDEQRQRINAITATTLGQYSPIDFGQNNENIVNILGWPLHKRLDIINWRSDFEINSQMIDNQQIIPLVLPVEKGNLYNNMRYTTDMWDGEYRAPYYDPQPLADRRLPIVQDKFPYLTVSDFLQDYIVKMPYSLNDRCFYSANYVPDHNEENSFLIPLKSIFFEYFSIETLRQPLPGNRQMLEIHPNIAGAKVILRIPVRGGIVEYSRVYFTDAAPNPNNNEGAIYESKFGLGVFPFVKFPDRVAPHYRVAMFDKDRSANISLSFVNKDRPVNTTHVSRIEKNVDAHGCSHEAYALTDNFDRILFAADNAEAYIIPLFPNVGAGTSYTFAVDYGTTNTHIEYAVNTNPRNSIPFNISNGEIQLIKLHKEYADADIRLAFDEDFIPEVIDAQSGFSFPMRTAFAVRNGIDYNIPTHTFADGNIPFLYEKHNTKAWNVVQTELKWGNVPQPLLQMHIEALMFMMRNKVLVNGGDLVNSKVIWFYPASMTVGKVNQFNLIWQNAYAKYFGGQPQNLFCISESTAPYRHFAHNAGAALDVVSIDIGGGTTDVYVVQGGQGRMLQSFRFASNAVFGDGYNNGPRNNGFISKYYNDILNVLNANNHQDLVQSLNQIVNNGKSSDIIAFFFSLQGPRVNNNEALDFLTKLQNDDNLRYVFILFYGSILYFVAKSMLANGLKKPATITFSGNGSKTVKIISPGLVPLANNIGGPVHNGADSEIARFAKLIFDGVYGDNHGNIDVLMERNPKIATCKGGIEDQTPQPPANLVNIKCVMPGVNMQIDNQEIRTYEDVTRDEDAIKTQVIGSVKDFFEFLFQINDANNNFFVNELNAAPTSYQMVKDFCTGERGYQLLRNSLDMGLRRKLNEVQISNTPLEETLFFYPLITLLHDLALEL